jgi:hypothetical protein
MMSIADMVIFCEQNPQYEKVLGMNPLIDPVRLGIRKVPAGFKEVLKNIHQRSPGSQMTMGTNNF